MTTAQDQQSRAEFDTWWNEFASSGFDAGAGYEKTCAYAAWKFQADRAAAQVQAMGRVPPTPAEIEQMAVKHEAFGFGQVDYKGLTTHGFDPEGLLAFVNELFAAAPRPPAAQEEDQ